MLIIAAASWLFVSQVNSGLDRAERTGLQSERVTSARAAGLSGIFGHKTLDIVDSAATVTVRRLAGADAPSTTPSADWIARFRKALDNRDDHLWLNEYKCGFNPGIFVKFTSPKGTAEARFCYHCGEISIIGPDSPKSKKQAMSPQGRKAFLLLFRELFLNDKEIQSIPLEPKKR